MGQPEGHHLRHQRHGVLPRSGLHPCPDRDLPVRYAGQPSGYYSNPFKDVGATSEASYYNAILWAVGKGITTGTSATTFSPYASCNRAEAVTFLYRYTNGL